MVTERVAAVVRVVEDYHSVLGKRRSSTHFCPTATALSEQEAQTRMGEEGGILGGAQAILRLPAENVYKYMIDRSRIVRKRKHYFLADFSEYFDDTSQWVFTDWCHLTAGANYLIAKELANLIKENFFSRPLTEGDKIDHKNSFFWDAGSNSEHCVCSAG